MTQSRTEKLVTGILPKYTDDPVGLLAELDAYNLTIVNAEMFEEMGELVGAAWDSLWEEYESE